MARPLCATSLLAAVGRMSLTNYLLTSVVFGAIFAGWGWGLFAEVTRSEAFALSLIPGVLMLLWSPLWLQRFAQGPVEWAWRWAARTIAARSR